MQWQKLNPIQALGSWVSARFTRPFWMRLGIYGGVSFSMGVIAWQQLKSQVVEPGSSQNYELMLERLIPMAEGAMRTMLSKQILAYQSQGEFATAQASDFPEQLRDRYHFVTWTSDTAEPYAQGPQQYLNGRTFPPPRDQGVVITLDTEQQHFIGIAYAIDETTARAMLCQGDRPFHPTEIQLLEQGGAIAAQCPKDASDETQLNQ